MRNHLVPGLGKHQLQKLTPQIVQKHLNAKAETGISVERLRRVLRSALIQAVKWDLVPRDAAALVREQGLVFATSVGTPLYDRNVRRTLDAILTKRRLPPMRFHDLRHTCATLLLVQGTDPRTIMETLGHSQVTLTLNTYSHVMPSLQRDAADKMQKLLAGG